MPFVRLPSAGRPGLPFPLVVLVLVVCFVSGSESSVEKSNFRRTGPVSSASLDPPLLGEDNPNEGFLRAGDSRCVFTGDLDLGMGIAIRASCLR